MRKNSVQLQRRLSVVDCAEVMMEENSVRRRRLSMSVGCMGRRNSFSRGPKQMEEGIMSWGKQGGFTLNRSLPTLLEEPMESDQLSTAGCDTASTYSENTAIEDPSDWLLDEDMNEEPVFVVVRRNELVEMKNEVIDQVAAHLNMNNANAALVLSFFSWDVERLLREYFDDPELYQQKAGLAVNLSPSELFGDDKTCPVCLEDKGEKNLYLHDCGHMYCLECWREYLHQRTISSGPEIVNTCCMHPNCHVKLNSQVFEKLALPEDFKRYNYFSLNEFVKSNPHMTICPNPSCGNAVIHQQPGRPSEDVECSCHTTFCFCCGQKRHHPISCELVQRWLTQLEDDGESVALIKATSKPCFHCKVFTERVSGCNHMTCRKETGGCGGEWCWMCRGDWSTHGPHTGGYYSCNKYDQSEAKVIDEQGNQFLKSTPRFLHYYNRFFNHDMLMKEMEQLINIGEVERKSLEYADITGTFPEFYKDAAHILLECRRVLKYASVFGFFNEDAPRNTLFEYQQASAEGSTERLSELFHKSVEVIRANPSDFVNCVRITKKYINNLVKSIEEGSGI